MSHNIIIINDRLDEMAAAITALKSNANAANTALPNLSKPLAAACEAALEAAQLCVTGSPFASVRADVNTHAVDLDQYA